MVSIDEPSHYLGLGRLKVRSGYSSYSVRFVLCFGSEARAVTGEDSFEQGREVCLSPFRIRRGLSG
jgi:hypothetical protein